MSIAKPISEIATMLGLGSAEVEPVGWYKAKFAADLAERLLNRPVGKYIGVTAVSPTPFGEGKTVVAIGLAMSLCRLGHRAVCTLREPSLAPVFGIKGGGAGGGRASLLPADDINLHFTGDLHAVTSAANLLAAMIDNHVRRRLEPKIEPTTVDWRRAIDMCDKGLAHIVTGLGGPVQAPLCETGFELAAASEVMAILALSASLRDLRLRLGRIHVGRTPNGETVTANDIGAAGAMAALLRDAIRPNLVQTCENTPAIVHAGPFGNIAHGNSSILGDRIALRLADYVVTESGFGADLGAEKFFHIKCRVGELRPAVEVLVCTIRALKHHSGRFAMRPGMPLPQEIERESVQAVKEGAENLRAHIEILSKFGIPVVLAVNRFPSDSAAELNEAAELGRAFGVRDVAIADPFSQGGDGCIDLAEKVIAACEEHASHRTLYDLESSLEKKFEIVAKEVYGAAEVDFSAAARRRLANFERLGYRKLPVCVAKTQYSLSHDPTLLGRPSGFRFPIQDVRVSAGAGFVYGLAGEIMTMPGLPSVPAATRIDVADDGSIVGLK